jgi:hypothetical protein
MAEPYAQSFHLNKCSDLRGHFSAITSARVSDALFAAKMVLAIRPDARIRAVVASFFHDESLQKVLRQV